MLLFHTPVLWVIGCVVVLAIGPLSGFVIADPGADRALHDTYIVVARFHYVYVLAVVFAFFAGWYYLFPRLTGIAYSRRLGNIHFWLTLAGAGAMLFPHVVVAAVTAPGVVDAPELIRRWNLVISIGSFASAGGLLVFLANMALSILRRRPAG